MEGEALEVDDKNRRKLRERQLLDRLSLLFATRAVPAQLLMSVIQSNVGAAEDGRTKHRLDRESRRGRTSRGTP